MFSCSLRFYFQQIEKLSRPIIHIVTAVASVSWEDENMLMWNRGQEDDGGATLCLQVTLDGFQSADFATVV